MEQHGKLLVETREQYDALNHEINILKENLPTMTPVQASVATELITKASEANAEFEQKSQTLGITFSKDIVEHPTVQEAERVVIQANEPEFNKEVNLQKDLQDIKNQIDSKFEELAINELNFNSATQHILVQYLYIS